MIKPPKKYYKILREILKVTRQNKSFLITSHLGPDGDSIASQLALSSFLKHLNKKVFIYGYDPVPKNYLFLPYSRQIQVAKKVPGKFDVAIVLDCGEIKRTGNPINFSTQAKILINIDHHLEGEKFASYSYVDPVASSVCEQIYNLMSLDGHKPTPQEAICLYTGILTDTGKFQQANTTPVTLRICAGLLEIGVCPARLFSSIYQTKSPDELRLLGLVLESMEIVNKSIGIFILEPQMYKKTQTSGKNVEGIIDYLNLVEGVKVGLLFRPVLNKAIQTWRVTFRSTDNIDVQSIARKFGGGGHRRAAGCQIQGTLSQVKKKVLQEVICSL